MRSFGNPAAIAGPEMVASLRAGRMPGGIGAAIETAGPALGLAGLAVVLAAGFWLAGRRRHRAAAA